MSAIAPLLGEERTKAKIRTGGLNVRRPQSIAPSIQLIGYFVDPGLDASLILFAARRA
jgi:hypothetical protein